MSALWISHLDVTDSEEFAKYAALAGDAIAAYGGVFLARRGRFEQLEGKGRASHVVIRFPSLEAARDCYDSAAYQAALKHAAVASERDLTILEEL
ncbi:DUF1330 domain-containing protein [Mesobaculum littorinae]|uniref:DUF1330 domain-containing protein n=1 Tax=Mesobaculum littorinae TaxID=2486419 RepID=A0A438ALK6_9RHOB|nr:DUF1330 domain-containing protein [Mesobaculum littorinae]RVV99628.1 DUF1330 domain-containing protein [Mesobaculum littorinae]